MNYGYDPTPYDDELAEAVRKVIAVWPADAYDMKPYVEVNALYPGVRVRRITHYSGEQRTFFTKQLDDAYKKVMEGKTLVDTGDLVMTASINALLEGDRLSLDTLLDLLRRHRKGDWGDINEADKGANDYAQKNGGERILSAYKDVVLEGRTDIPIVTIWIITEADRSVTTFLLPEDY